MDVPAPAAGTVKEVRVKLNDKVSEGSLIVVLESDSAGAAKPAATTAAAPPKPAPAPTATAAPPPAAAPEPAPVPKPAFAPAAVSVDEESFKGAHASPSVRKFARDLGVDLSRVTATGPKNRILHEDVQNFVKQAMSGAAPAGAGAGITGGGALNLLPWPKV